MALPVLSTVSAVQIQISMSPASGVTIEQLRVAFGATISANQAPGSTGTIIINGVSTSQ